MDGWVCIVRCMCSYSPPEKGLLDSLWEHNIAGVGSLDHPLHNTRVVPSFHLSLSFFPSVHLRIDSFYPSVHLRIGSFFRRLLS